MAEFTKLPSGLHQAIVVTPIKLPSGRYKRVTKTHRLKGVVEEWAKTTEGAIAAGTWIDDKKAATTLGEYRQIWRSSRIADNSTVKKTD